VRLSLRWLAALALAAAPGAQAPAPSGELHRPHLQLAPAEAFANLQRGHAIYLHVRGPEAPSRVARPPGAGRYVAAVLADSELDHDPAELLGQRRRDLLLLNSPGPCVRSTELARLERAVRHERLTLCVILVAEDSASLRAPATNAPPDAIHERTAPSRELAARAALPVATAHALATGRLLLSASAELAARHVEGTLRVVGGVVDRKGNIAWLPDWIEPATPTPAPPPRPAGHR
jgi:hypothetical protein